MKKFLILLLSAVLSLACVMGFAACTERPGDETGGIAQPGDPSWPDDPDDPDKPHEHDFGEWTVTVPATCTEAGEEQRTCSCGETETRIVAASGHDYVNGVCTRCEDTITATDDSYFTFTELEDGTYSVAWDEDTALPAEVVIPWEYNGKSVTQIGDWAFAYCDSLTSVTIPSSVTSIGEGAFGRCTSLTSVTISSGVTSIGKMAFYDCRSLTSIAIPDGVTSIGDGAFLGCDSLMSVAIGDDVAFIGMGVFEGCRSLTSITVSAENPVYHSDGNCLIETESKTLVVGCKNSVIPDDGSVTSIGAGAFYECENLTSIVIPDGVTSIGDAAFGYCDSLTSITIPNGVTSIGDGAFLGCDSLMSVAIGDDVAFIGIWVFEGCRSLTNITVSSENRFYHNTGDCLIETESKTLIWGSGTSVIPDGVTSIGDKAFSGCTSFTSITIPDSVTSIGDEAFAYCDSLTSITIPDSVTSIGYGAFGDCKSLASVTIPDGVTSIGDSAFRDCSSLTSVVFANPNGWRVDGEAISAADLSDPATAAEYLTNTYCRDVWTRI